MKPHLLKVPVKQHHSFSIRYDAGLWFYDQWHYHPEIELLHIHKGSGTHYIGNKLERFGPDEMLLIGSNLPHLFRSDKKYYQKASRDKCEATVIHFNEAILGDNFWSLPESSAVARLLHKARQGIRITGPVKARITFLMKQLFHAEGMERLILLFQILQNLTQSKKNKLISQGSMDNSLNHTENERLNAVYQFIFQNFNDSISLKQVASVANLTQNSFCRYFKTRTKKTFSHFLLEVRVNHACKQLGETDKNINDICFESGFNNFSNFYRHFKIIMGQTPLQYKKLFRGE